MTKEERAALVERRKMEFQHNPDFCPADGICWSCKTDLVERYGDRFPRIYISGCPVCHRSYCE